MNESLSLGLQADVKGTKDVGDLGDAIGRIPAAADRAGKALESSGSLARAAASGYQAAGQEISKYSGSVLTSIEAVSAFVGAHTLATGSLAKYSVEALRAGSATDTLANGYRALRIALSPTLFTAASVGVGILAEETIKLANARGRLIEQQALIAAKGGLSFGTVETINAAASLGGGNASNIDSALKALQKRAGTAKYTDALDSIAVPKYFQDAGSPRLLTEIAKGFSDIADPAIRAKAAVDLFGNDEAGTALSQLNRRFAESAKAVDDWGLTLDDTSRDQIYEFRRDLQNFKDDVLSLGTGFEALKGKIEQAFTVGGAKTYSTLKSGYNWYFEGLGKLDERFGTKNPFTVNEEAKRNMAESSDVLGAALKARGNPAGEDVGMGIRGDMFSFTNRTPGRDDFDSRLSEARSLQAEIKKTLAGGDLTAAQITSLSSALLGTAQEINAAKAGLQGIDISKRQSEAFRSSQDLAYRSQFEPGAGRNFRGELSKASTFVDSETGDIQHMTLLDGTRRNIEAAFETYAQSLMQKTSEEQIKTEESSFQRRIQLEEQFWKKRQSYGDETARIEIGTFQKTFESQNTLAGYTRDERLAGLGSLNPNSPRIVGDRLSQIGQRRGIQTDYITSTSLNDSETIDRNKETSLMQVAMALKAGNISDSDAAGRNKAIEAAAAQQGSALNARFEHDILMANSDAAKETRDVLRDVLERQTEALKSTVGGLFGAATGGNPSRAIPEFLKSEVLGFGKTLSENFATQKLLPAIKPLLPSTSNSLFKDTFLFDPLKGLGARPTGTATDPIYVASAILAAGSGSTTGGALAGRFGGGSSGSPFIFSATGSGGSIGDYGAGNYAFGDLGEGAASDMPGSLPDGLPISLAKKSPMGSLASSGSGFGLNVGTLAKGAGVVGAGISAYSDLRTGGVKNDIAGAGSTLMGAAGIAAMFGPAGAPVALGLAIAGMATSIVSSILPDPKAVRAAAIQKAIERNKYQAPTSLNVSQDTSGNFIDTDARGNLRQSNFRSIPEVSEPYTWWKGSTPYQVPGGQTSPYSPWPNGSAPAPTTVIIQAADAQSFNDMAQRNRAALSDAVGSHLQSSGDSRLHAAIRSLAGN